jgi:hypothetical protein
MPDSAASLSAKSKGRARLTNSMGLLPSVDGRSEFARRFRDLNGLLVSDLGGEQASLSEGQKQLVRRVSALAVECERLEGRFAQNGGAELNELETFQRTTNTLRRAIESLGLHRGRIARDVTPPDLQTYLAQRAARQAEEEAQQ